MPLRVSRGVPRVATLLRLYMERPSRDGGARGYPPRDGGIDGESGGDMAERWLKRFPGVASEWAERFWLPPTRVMGDPWAGAAFPEA
jgi:hypothetical protein